MNKLRFQALVGAASLSATVAFAQSPKVSNVTMSQDHVSRVVTINYDLDETADPGIVTFDILTNGVSIGAENIKGAVGDLGRIQIPDGNRKTIKWPAAQSWPGHNLKEACVTARVTAWSTNNPPPVMVIDLNTKEKSFYTHLAQLPGGISDRVYKTEKLVMKRIPAAGVTWTMGDSVSKPTTGRTRPHKVSFSEDFYIGVYEVTRGQMALVDKGANRTPTSTDFETTQDVDAMPADKVGYGQATIDGTTDQQLRGYGIWPRDGHSVPSTSIIAQFRQLGVEFDLPTSAQWEFACRAGTASTYNNGTNDGLNEVAWHKGNSAIDGVLMPHVVGTRKANDFGLFDMHGNVSEWVLDRYDPDGSSFDGNDVSLDPKGLESAATGHTASRTWRGGSYDGTQCGSHITGNRNYNSVTATGFGFRLWAPVGVN